MTKARVNFFLQSIFDLPPITMSDLKKILHYNQDSPVYDDGVVRVILKKTASND
jgi:hypothetical protein